MWVGKNSGSEMGKVDPPSFVSSSSVSSCVVLGGSFNLSKPQFLHLFGKQNKTKQL